VRLENRINLKDRALSSRRNEGAFSTTRASEIHDAGIALFSVVVSFGLLVTSLGSAQIACPIR